MDIWHRRVEFHHVANIQTGKTFTWALYADVAVATETIKYYSGWADKITGQTLETTESKLTYTRHEPIGVVVRHERSGQH